jgi:hypothetical protein
MSQPNDDALEEGRDINYSYYKKPSSVFTDVRRSSAKADEQVPLDLPANNN